MSDQDADRDAIIALIHRNRIAIWTGDYDAWEDCFVHAPYTTRWGWWQSGGIFVRQGWDELVKRARSSGPTPRLNFAYDTEVLNLSLQIGSDMAWATFNQQYPEPDTLEEGGTGLTYELRVFEKRDGQWKIALVGLLIGAAGGENVVRLDGERRVLWAKPSVAARLGEDDHLVLRNGMLRFRDRRLDRELVTAVEWAASLDDTYMSTNGAWPIVAEAGEGLPTSIYWIIADGGMVLFSFGEQRANERRLDLAARIYRLSPAQRKLAGHVAEGMTLGQIAARMSITENTARTHLDRVFEKTGVRTQPALVRVLLSAIAPV
jgi:DNA-binding CsgD family transcriptional regulator